MAKSRGFSIYLLKSTFSEENALKDDHNLELISEESTNLPEGSVMYISDKPANAPWWKDYWGISKDLRQMQKGALIFLPIADRWAVLTFGMTYHQLKDNCYEYDFGLRTTLNALDPEKIKSTDILQPENAKRQRIQSPTASNLNFFDIRQDESIIKKLTGAVKDEYRNLFTNATGASSLKISSNLPPDEIVDLCSSLIEIYDKTDYIESFPDIQNIVPVRDPDKIKILNDKLLESFNTAPMELVLSIPEVIDYSTSFKIKFTGAGRSINEYNDVFIAFYREYLSEKGIVSVDDVDLFYRHKMSIIDENDIILQSYSIYKSFLFDCEVDNISYHLCDGEWYKIDSNYVHKLSTSLDPYFVNTHSFLHPCDKVREDDYNISVKDVNADVFCLDKTSITPPGQTQVEPCDLISIVDNKVEMLHIKISTRSSSLSHLFNQGVNSIELLRMEQQSREKLKVLIGNDANISSLIDISEFRVVYGIITKKNSSRLSKNLPIFSRISLLRAVNALKMMNIPCSIFYIYDNIDRR